MVLAMIQRRKYLAIALALIATGFLAMRPLKALAADKPGIEGKVLLLAAASTTDAIDKVRAEFLKLHPQVTLRVSFGSSSALAKQIENGEAADLFLSASREWSDYLQKRKLVARSRDLLSNELVIVVPSDSKLSIARAEDLAQEKVGRLALADSSSVPAGIYARQALEKLKLWDKLKGKVVGAADVRQALLYVETSAAEAGIVYATDAAASKKVRVVGKIDPKLSDPIRYPLVLTPAGEKNPVAVACYEFLQSPAAAKVFRDLGFVVLEKDKAAGP